MPRSKVTVVGAGNVGATVAQRIFDKGYADVVLVDIVEGLPQGKALDMLESGPVLGSDASVVGTNDYEPTAGSDVVVITSGIARRPGMSRDDLLLTNMNIVTAVTGEVAKHSPDSIPADRYQPPGRDGAASIPGIGIPQEPRRGHGRDTRHRAVQNVPCGGAERVGELGRGLRAGRPRGHHGAQ